MKKLILILLTLLGTSFCKAQNVADFEKEFQQIAENNFPDHNVDSLYKKYNHILFWFNANSQLAASIKNLNTLAYPLKEFKQSSAYKNNIDILLADTAYRKYLLGCFLACATYDTSKTERIAALLKASNYKAFWLASILTYLNPKDFRPILNCILLYKDSESVSYLMSDFLKMDKDRIEKFGMDSLFSSTRAIQYLAIKSLAQTPPTPQKELLLKKAVLQADTTMKGWAIAVLSHYQAGEMLTLLKPYLANKDLKSVCLRALASSNTANDVAFIDNLIAKEHYEPDFLNALLNSENHNSIKKWLAIASANKLPKDYYIDIMRNTTIKNNRYYDAISEIIINNKNEQQLDSLMFYFDGKKDQKSIAFLNKCLSHPIVAVKERATQFLKN